MVLCDSSPTEGWRQVDALSMMASQPVSERRPCVKGIGWGLTEGGPWTPPLAPVYPCTCVIHHTPPPPQRHLFPSSKMQVHKRQRERQSQHRYLCEPLIASSFFGSTSGHSESLAWEISVLGPCWSKWDRTEGSVKRLPCSLTQPSSFLYPLTSNTCFLQHAWAVWLNFRWPKYAWQFLLVRLEF